MKLPAFEDLSKEQDLIYNLDLDGRFLISGPPGTGKSVMALYRAQALSFDDRTPAVLMYSNVLKQYTAQAARSIDVAGYVQTFHSWFGTFWRRHYKSSVPMLSDRWTHDWPTITQQFLTRPAAAGVLADVIVDEGQDLSLDFYRLTRFLAGNVTVFADENQKLLELHTTLDEIEKAIGASEHLVLRRNYRNTAEIAAVAAQYYCGAPTGIPDPPTRHGDRPTLRRFGSLNDFVELLARYVRAHSDLSIGVACPTTKLQTKLMNRLAARSLQHVAQTYISSDPDQKVLDFEKPLVTIVNYRSLKGLEFDTLFVPELQLVTADPTAASTRMMFYVVMSRARNELHLSWTGEPGSPPKVLDSVVPLVEVL